MPKPITIRHSLLINTIILLLIGMNYPYTYHAETVGSPIVDITSSSIQGKIVKVSGTVQNVQTAKVVIKGDNFTSSDIIVDAADEGKWSYTFPEEFTEGTYHYIIETTDTSTDTPPPPSQTDLDFQVDLTGPVVNIANTLLQTSKSFPVSGTVTDNYSTGEKLQLELLDSNSNPISGAILSKKPSSTSNEFAFTLNDPPTVEGTYQYKVKASDEVGNLSIKNVDVKIDNTRPMVSDLKLNLSDFVSAPGQNSIDLLMSDDINYVKTDSTIIFSITDETMLDKDKIKNSIIVFNSHNANIPGDITITEKSTTNIEVVFKPKTPLETSTSYYILINPVYIDAVTGTEASTDAAGNPVYPLIRKFTTERQTDIAKIPTGESDYHKLNDPHGNNFTNTNTCGNCHNTHNSKNGANLEQPVINYSTYNYCMACHDGTVAAKPLNIQENNHFPEYAADGVKKMATECSSCHDPHLTWSKENPNRLKDHFVHVHNDTEKQRTNANYPFGQEIDSMVKPCETCHDSDTQRVKDQYIYNHNDATKQQKENYPYLVNMNTLNNESPACESCHDNIVDLVKEYDSQHEDHPIAVNYRIFNYKKSSSTGIPEDYALCIRCHDGTKKWTDNNNVEHEITNIKQYYDINTDEKDTTNSNVSMHRITAVTGGKMVKSTETTSNDGHIPCAECHDTHGSSNKSLIKQKLGQEDRRSFTLNAEWDATKEREFCLSCHNGSTAIYGVTGKAIFDQDTGLALDPTITGHDRTSPYSCAKCHSDNNSFMEAAHAPKKGKNP